jgi:hypothetical protein
MVYKGSGQKQSVEIVAVLLACTGENPCDKRAYITQIAATVAKNATKKAHICSKVVIWFIFIT